MCPSTAHLPRPTAPYTPSSLPEGTPERPRAFSTPPPTPEEEEEETIQVSYSPHSESVLWYTWRKS